MNPKKPEQQREFKPSRSLSIALAKIKARLDWYMPNWLITEDYMNRADQFFYVKD